MSTLVFDLGGGTEVPVLFHLVQQVKRALRLGVVEVGHRLATMCEVVAIVAINPSTIFNKACPDAPEGLVASHRGPGTTLGRCTLEAAPPEACGALRRNLHRWTWNAGLDGGAVPDLLMRAADQARGQAT